MSALATWIVPPNYEAQIFGLSAVEISARKISLINLSGQVSASVFYGRNDAISASMPFGDLVDFVRKKLAS